MNPQDSMKDWPRSLKINHEAILLAPLLYKATCEIWGGVAGDFAELVPRVRQRFIEDAAEMLKRDRRVDREPLQLAKAPAHVAPSQPYIPVRGFLTRCCRDSLESYTRDGLTPRNGHEAWCRHCARDVIYRDGAWEQKA